MVAHITLILLEPMFVLVPFLYKYILPWPVFEAMVMRKCGTSGLKFALMYRLSCEGAAPLH